MKRTSTFLTLLLVCLVSIGAMAQTIHGTVTDAKTNEPLIGVSVIVEGTQRGTITDYNGQFDLQASPGDNLITTYVGYEDMHVTIKDGQNDYVITMAPSNIKLDEVVVTALGISRKKKALGYSVEQVSSEAIENNGRSDVVSALQGRVSGLQIQNSSGAPGAASSILIRGINSLDPSRSNRPLYVIDGVEVNDDVDIVPTLPSSANFGVGSSNATQGSVSNRMSDIDPNDIESISVLKGGQATALYGVRASNGAIVITTKRGKKGAPSVDVNLGTGWNEVNRTPKVQRKFIDGHRSTTKRRSNIWDNWGSIIRDDNPIQTYDIYNDFYQRGKNQTFGASINAGTDRFKYRLSSNLIRSEGIVPFSNYRRIGLALNTEYKVNSKLSVKTNVRYANSGGNTPPEGRKSVANVLAYAANVVDMTKYHTPYTAATNFAHGWIDHPLFLAQYNTNINNINRFIGGVNLKYRILSNFALHYNLGVDTYSDFRERIAHPETDEGQSGVQVKPAGFIVNNALNKMALTSNLFATYSTGLGDKINLDFTLGQYAYGWNKKRQTVVGESFVLDNFFNASNTLRTSQSNGLARYRNLAFYGEATASYDNYLYVTVTGRNDRSSTLPKQNNSYFFPGASASLILSDMVELPSMVNFAKLRASWAKVGKDADIYKIGRYYGLINTWSDGVLEYGGSTVVGDENLKPEFSTTLEFGGEFSFFKNRLGLNATYYSTKTTDMILPVPLSNATGASRYITNAGGMTNKGIELSGFVKLIDDYMGFDWTTALNWSKNTGIIDGISIDADEIVIKSLRGITSKYVPGGKVGDLYGSPWNRTEDGQLIIESDGMPRVNWDTTVLLGNAMPDWILGWDNQFAYKNLGLSFLWEWKKGGDVIDISRNYSIGNGQLEETNDRYKEVVFKGVKKDADGNYVKNDIKTEITGAGFYRNWKVYRFAPEVYLQDASWVRLRNLSVFYNLPGSALAGLGIQKARLTFTVNNAFLNTPFNGWDPESNYFGPGSNVYGYLGLRTPQTKSYNLKLNITF